MDRKKELEEWVTAWRVFLVRNISIFAFANNHCAGHGLATMRLFQELFQKKV